MDFSNFSAALPALPPADTTTTTSAAAQSVGALAFRPAPGLPATQEARGLTKEEREHEKKKKAAGEKIARVRKEHAAGKERRMREFAEKKEEKELAALKAQCEEIAGEMAARDSAATIAALFSPSHPAFLALVEADEKKSLGL